VPALLSQPGLNTARAGIGSCRLFPTAGGLAQYFRKIGRNTGSLTRGQEMGYFRQSVENFLTGGMGPAPGVEAVQSRLQQ